MWGAAGSFKESRGDSFDGRRAVLAVIFARFRAWDAGLADYRDCEVSEGGEGSGPGADAASVLVEGDVSDVMEAVLDGPVGACEGHQPFGRSLVGRHAGDQIDRLDALAAPDFAGALQFCDLRQPRPFEIGDRLGGDGDAACLNAAMARVESLGFTQIGRRFPRGGNRRPWRFRYRA